MAKRTVSVVRPSASDVRKFYAENPARAAKFSEKDAHTLREGARGRLAAKVIADYNKGRKPERQYVLGVGKSKTSEAKALREKVVAAGGGRRGPIAKSVLATLGEAKG
jgi:hypothetical protein